MAIPSILRSRKTNSTEKHDLSSPTSPTREGSVMSDAVIRRATRLRKGFALSASFSYVLAWIFLVLVRP